jgi:EAL domain-containing protein (putative c-di-GMP-specific phosphodiesterase class I)
VPDHKDPPEVEAVLRDLVARGLLTADSGDRETAQTRAVADLDEALGHDEPVFVSACGLRNLTILNHLYGAAVGDLAMEVTRAVAAAVLDRYNPDAEILTAPGPDLFVLHGSVSQRQVETLAGRLCAVLGSVNLPASAGVVALRPLVATVELRSPSAWSPDDVVRTLQEVRTRALDSELGRAVLAGDEAEEALQSLRRRDKSLVWVTDALRQGEVEVHFQPVIDLRSGRLRDVEALARIRTPERLLAASEFIDLVHDLGETAALDAQVLRAIAVAASELARTTQHLFVNVSPLSLGASAFRDVMADTIARLHDQGVDFVVVLELTEQALLEHHGVIREIHREHGVSFAVDDFGTGYSSLKTVSDLAVSRVVSTLKIDGSLTREMAASREAFKVVLAVAQMARSLDLRVIAEHVETPEILARLRSTGIECGQGFLFDPPLPSEALVARYAGRTRFAPEVAPRRHLHLLEPYLSRAFAAFYDTLLSDPHFRRYFQDEAQIRSLIERQRQTFLESLDDEPEALGRRYARLGRLHHEMGLPLAAFLKGAALLHQELLGVLVHATREVEVFRDTERFFASLRDFMARGYLECETVRHRGELSDLRSWAEGLGLEPAMTDAAFACAGGVLTSVELLRTPPPATPARGLPRPRMESVRLEEGRLRLTAATPLSACPLTPVLERGTGGAPRDAVLLHTRMHADAESLDYFLSRDEDAAVVPLLEGLLGRLPRLLVAVAGAPGASPGA